MGIAQSLGAVNILFPLGGIIIKIIFYIININTPLLIYLKNIDYLSIFYNNMRDPFIHYKSN